MEGSFYEISLSRQSPDDIEVYPPKSVKNGVQFVWRWGRDKSYANLITEIVGYKTESHEYRVVRKMRHTSKIIRSMLLETEYSGRSGSSECEKLFNRKIFSFPKPIALLKKLSSITTKENDIILDFFSGSATTAHAVMQLNAEDGGKRKFILVQLPEACDPKSEAFKAGYQTIADIGKERIRRAGQKIKTDNGLAAVDLDIGFRVLKVDTSNMNEVYYTPDATTQSNLLALIDNITPDRTDEDLLFQVLLDWGVDLSYPIITQTLDDKKVFIVAGNAIVACFDRHGGITEAFIKQLATLKPLRAVFCDAGFASDSVKINVEQIFKLISPSTEIKTL